MDERKKEYGRKRKGNKPRRGSDHEGSEEDKKNPHLKRHEQLENKIEETEKELKEEIQEVQQKLNSQIKQTQQEVADVNNQITNLNDSFSEFIQKAEKQYKELKREDSETKEELLNKAEEIKTDLSQKINSIGERIKTTTDQLSKLQKQYNDEKEFSNQILKVQAQLKELKEQINGFNTDLQDLNGVVDQGLGEGSSQPTEEVYESFQNIENRLDGVSRNLTQKLDQLHPWITIQPPKPESTFKFTQKYAAPLDGFYDALYQNAFPDPEPKLITKDTFVAKGLIDEQQSEGIWKIIFKAGYISLDGNILPHFKMEAVRAIVNDEIGNMKKKGEILNTVNEKLTSLVADQLQTSIQIVDLRPRRWYRQLELLTEKINEISTEVLKLEKLIEANALKFDAVVNDDFNEKEFLKKDDDGGYIDPKINQFLRKYMAESQSSRGKYLVMHSILRQYELQRDKTIREIRANGYGLIYESQGGPGAEKNEKNDEKPISSKDFLNDSQIYTETDLLLQPTFHIKKSKQLAVSGPLHFDPHLDFRHKNVGDKVWQEQELKLRNYVLDIADFPQNVKEQYVRESQALSTEVLNNDKFPQIIMDEINKQEAKKEIEAQKIFKLMEDIAKIKAEMIAKAEGDTNFFNKAKQNIIRLLMSKGHSESITLDRNNLLTTLHNHPTNFPADFINTLRQEADRKSLYPITLHAVTLNNVKFYYFEKRYIHHRTFFISTYHSWRPRVDAGYSHNDYYSTQVKTRDVDWRATITYTIPIYSTIPKKVDGCFGPQWVYDVTGTKLFTPNNAKPTAIWHHPSKTEHFFGVLLAPFGVDQETTWFFENRIFDHFFKFFNSDHSNTYPLYQIKQSPYMAMTASSYDEGDRMNWDPYDPMSSDKLSDIYNKTISHSVWGDKESYRSQPIPQQFENGFTPTNKTTLAKNPIKTTSLNGVAGEPEIHFLTVKTDNSKDIPERWVEPNFYSNAYPSNVAFDFLENVKALYEQKVKRDDREIKLKTQDIKEIEGQIALIDQAIKKIIINNVHVERWKFIRKWLNQKTHSKDENNIEPNDDPLAEALKDIDGDIGYFRPTAKGFVNQFAQTIPQFLSISGPKKKTVVLSAYDRFHQLSTELIQIVTNPKLATGTSSTPKLPKIQFMEYYDANVEWEGYSIGTLAYSINLLPGESKNLVIDKSTKVSRSTQDEASQKGKTSAETTSSFEENLSSTLKSSFTKDQSEEQSSNFTREFSDTFKNVFDRQTNQTSSLEITAKASLGFFSLGASTSKKNTSVQESGFNSTDESVLKESHRLDENALTKQHHEMLNKRVRNVVNKSATKTSRENTYEISTASTDELEIEDMRKETINVENQNMGRTVNHQFFHLQNVYATTVLQTGTKIIIDTGRELIAETGVTDVKVYGIESFGKIYADTDQSDYAALMCAIIVRQVFNNYLQVASKNLYHIIRGNGSLQLTGKPDDFESNKKHLKTLRLYNAAEETFITQLKEALEWLDQFTFQITKIPITKRDVYAVNTGGFHVESQVGFNSAIEGYLEERREIETAKERAQLTHQQQQIRRNVLFPVLPSSLKSLTTSSNSIWKQARRGRERDVSKESPPSPSEESNDNNNNNNLKGS